MPFFLYMFQFSEHCAPETGFMLFEEIESKQLFPKHLRKLLTDLPLALETSDILCAIIPYLLLEMGFIVGDLSTPPSDDITLPTSCSYSEDVLIRYVSLISDSIKKQQSCANNKSIEIFKFSMKLVNFSENILTLVIRKVFNGNTLCITFCYNEYSHTVVLNINDYVHKPLIIDDDLLQNPTKYFKNTESLAYKVRSTVIIPIRNQLMLDEGYTFAGLLGVPKEIQWTIFKLLGLTSLQDLSKTCIRLRSDIISFVNGLDLKITTERQSTPIIWQPNNPDIGPRFRAIVFKKRK